MAQRKLTGLTGQARKHSETAGAGAPCDWVMDEIKGKQCDLLLYGGS